MKKQVLVSAIIKGLTHYPWLWVKTRKQEICIELSPNQRQALKQREEE
ncbi:MAG: hypothetical protein M0P59_13485 [Gallionella sp.]|jgi:hypothetical protein|nr:hypothetical protein [Gallionella sp.]